MEIVTDGSSVVVLDRVDVEEASSDVNIESVLDKDSDVRDETSVVDEIGSDVEEIALDRDSMMVDSREEV